MPLQGVANQLVRVLLRAPLVSRVVGKRLITVYVVGRSPDGITTFLLPTSAVAAVW